MRCPKCGEGITYLYNYQKAEVRYIFEMNDEGRGHYEQDETIPCDFEEYHDYECPECLVRLASSEKDAVAFMTGEDITSEMAAYYMELAIEGDDR